MANLSQGQVGASGRDGSQRAPKDLLEADISGHGSSATLSQAPSTGALRAPAFTTGSVSPRKELRGRKRRPKSSQMLVSEDAHPASSFAVANLACPPLLPLAGQLHMQLQTKMDANASPQGNHNAPIAGPLLQESPLGLTLKKTPSLLELISNTLGQRASEKLSGHTDPAWDVLSLVGRPSRSHRDPLSALSGPSAADKLKASNFAALSVKIGTWERHSRYEGDLVAKCYFAKKKLVWEVLDKGLKSKIEVQWSDIRRIKAAYSESEPGVLEIEISRSPMFFHEMSPQPRKHTIWSNAPDFTGGQATIARKHVLTFPPGVLEPHYKKLLLCDSRLRALAAGLPEPVAVRPPLYNRLQVPRLFGSPPCVPTPRHLSGAGQGVPSAAGPSTSSTWSGLVDNMQRVLLQEQPGSPSSVIARGDRPFGEESASSDGAGQFIPPAGLGLADANFARETGANEPDEMMLDSPFTPNSEEPFSSLDFSRSPSAGLFPDMSYDLPNSELLLDSDMEGPVNLDSCHTEAAEGHQEREAADQSSSSQPQGFSGFPYGGTLRRFEFSSSLPSLGSEMSAFHVVQAGPRGLRGVGGKPSPGPSLLDHLDDRLGNQGSLPDVGHSGVYMDSTRGPSSAAVWREEQDTMVQY